MRIIRFLLVMVVASFGTINCFQNDTQKIESSEMLHQNITMQSTVSQVRNCPNCPNRETPAIMHWLHAQTYYTGQNTGISNVVSVLLLFIII